MMQMALLLSFGLHLVVLIAGMVGMPYIKKDREPPKPIMVEIVDIADVTTTDKKPAPQRPKKPTVEEAPKAEKKIKAPPKVVSKEPPKIDPLKKVEVDKDTVKPKPKTPPPPDKKLEKVKEPEKKKEKPNKKEAAATPEEDPLDSLLKNLQDEETSNGENDDDKPAEEKQAPDAVLSKKLTMTQIDALIARLRVQFAGCWGVVAGAREAEKIAVVLLITVNPDRTVKNVRVQDQWRYTNDSFYRAAADAARRAVYHPDCKILDVPEDYYDEWKEIEFNFDPAEML